MIKNVIFDIGRVMIEFNWEEFLCGLFDPETAKIVSDAMWGTAAWDELDRNVLPMEDVIKLFIANAPDCEPQICEAMRRLGDCAKMMPHAIGWVEELKARGYRVFYLSNYFWNSQSIWTAACSRGRKSSSSPIRQSICGCSNAMTSKRRSASLSTTARRISKRQMRSGSMPCSLNPMRSSIRRSWTYWQIGQNNASGFVQTAEIRLLIRKIPP